MPSSLEILMLRPMISGKSRQTQGMTLQSQTGENPRIGFRLRNQASCQVDDVQGMKKDMRKDPPR